MGLTIGVAILVLVRVIVVSCMLATRRGLAVADPHIPKTKRYTGDPLLALRPKRQPLKRCRDMKQAQFLLNKRRKRRRRSRIGLAYTRVRAAGSQATESGDRTSDEPSAPQ